jgi:hypothetical protein
MDTAYREIYEQLFDSAFDRPRVSRRGRLVRVSQPPQIARHVLAAINRADRRLLDGGRSRLRPDAKYLLYVNFVEMIVIPLLAAGRVNEEQILPALEADVDLLVFAASEAQKQKAQELSGHAVIDALSDNWRRLKLTAFDIWE